MKEVVFVLHVTKKAAQMNTLQTFYIHLDTSENNQINDRCKLKTNAIWCNTTKQPAQMTSPHPMEFHYARQLDMPVLD
jgi:hypothetical protein